MTSTSAGPDSTDVRREFREWVDENWDPELSLVDWRRRLVDAAWATPSWPQRWHGRDLPKWADEIVLDELHRAGIPALPLGTGTNLAAPTLLAQASEEVCDRFLGPILTGEETWCQLFSEPGAGSDLAGLTTRAERDGDTWVVNGQKVWNTSAHHADFGLLVARTDWDVPKHRGLSYFVIPMNQDGVEARPLRQMNNYSSFNEVFMTDARIPHEFLVGTEGDGWRVALTTLAFERKFGAVARPDYGDAKGRALDEARAEADEHFKTYEWYPQRAGRVDLVVPRAQETGKITDPAVRQEVARLLSMQQAAQWTADRARAARDQGRTPGPEGSIGKLANSNIARQASVVHSMISGADGMLTGPDSPLNGVIAEILISVPAHSIAGGTDQIQRNILSEKALGLPRDPSVDRDKPFREVAHNR